jgi:hypothetical protein
MSQDFHLFAKAVHDQYERMAKHELYNVTTQDIFTSYLLAFPEGTNPIFRKQTEHDCSCCKNFVRNLGNVVAFIDGKRATVWDNCESLPEPYNIVAQAMRSLVLQAPIDSVFRTKEHKYGADKTPEQMEDGSIHVWRHFHGKVASRFTCLSPDEDRGKIRTNAAVLKRALDEITPATLETVLELINSKAIYRGAEFQTLVLKFKILQNAYNQSADKEALIWANADMGTLVGFRNSVIGTLCVDLAAGVPLEDAVRMYESKVAPQNYKRPTALVTPKMIDAALKTLEDLGLSEAVDRRMARMSDISINDVLWANNAAQSQMKPSLRDKLLTGTKANPDARAQEISVEDFMSSVVPAAKSMDIVLKNSDANKFVTLTAPQVDTDKLFKWNNAFGWSYDGEVTDSIAAKVKRAGGNTDTAKLRISLAWHNADDLDLHCSTPRGNVNYSAKGGILDVDTNGLDRQNHIDPVENLSWTDAKLVDGPYQVRVNQYSKRSTTNPGFEMEFFFDGKSQMFSHPKDHRNGYIDFCSFTVVKGEITKLVFDSRFTADNAPVTKWGVATQTRVPVSVIMNSPNHWDDAGGVGNKHWFFMLQNCKNPSSVRGIYNEFLKSDLDQHRKVFEMIGSKTKCEPTDDQLSGVGFSSTRSDTVQIIVDNKTYNVKF